MTTQTATLGQTWAISSVVASDFRFNYSSTETSISRPRYLRWCDPLGPLPFSNPYTAGNAQFIFHGRHARNHNPTSMQGANAHNQQRQINIVDSVSILKGSHSLKLGVDYRRLSPRCGSCCLGQIESVPRYTQRGNRNLLITTVAYLPGAP